MLYVDALIVFNSRESDVENSPVNDRLKIGEGFHAVPPSYTGNYMPSRPDISFDGPSAPIIEDWDIDSDNDSVFRPKTEQTKPKFTKINFVKSDENVKSVNKENTHKQVEYPRKSQSPRGSPKGDPLGNFNRKADEGFFVGYSINTKAFKVFNTRTRKAEENLHITFLEYKPNVAGSGLDWLY
ncbi:hypothetical protein Tco_1082822 [Tanacetum coccineum]|uniref:Retroviral polymerase SH3-like domain-containing protein n=1 Tax=Tanacetum coccineum TaxID=301880 RepID=A0ABQ5I1K2_9ASTR